MDWIIENWTGLLAVIVLIGGAIIYLYRFSKLTIEQQKEQLTKWLLLAVTSAEKEFGSGTGQLKLREVFDSAIKTFPLLMKFMTFEDFSKLVDDALEEMKKMLESNKAAKSFVEGTTD